MTHSDKLQARRGHQGSPWGRTRYAGVAGTLRRRCADRADAGAPTAPTAPTAPVAQRPA